MSGFNEDEYSPTSSANCDSDCKSSSETKRRFKDSEEQHWWDVMRTFLMYHDFSMSALTRRQEHLNRLSEQQAAHLPKETFEKLAITAERTKMNAAVLREVAASYNFYTYGKSAELPHPYEGIRIRYSEQHRNKAVLHSMAREWSVSGAYERKAAFDPMLAELQKYIPVSEKDAYTKRVLVPGCGLGRLPAEVASEGYSVEGNEFSAFMLMAGNYIMNEIQRAEQWQICPWLDSTCNVINTSDPYTPVFIPDRTAADIITSGKFHHSGADNDTTQPYPRFSMAAGDFVEIYGPNAPSAKESFDAILTCFFIDTAPVVVDYVEAIFHVLKPGGVWINLGPLLYHWATDSDNNGDSRYDQSVELSWEEVRHVIEHCGFRLQPQPQEQEVEKPGGRVVPKPQLTQGHGEVRFLECPYSRSGNQLMWTAYDSIFFTAVKPK
jgi:carnosine N-methyltransferase